MQEVICKINKKQIERGNEFYEIQELISSKTYKIPSYQLQNVEIGQEHIFIKIYDKNRNKTLLELKSEPVNLEIIKTSTFTDKKGNEKMCFIVKFKEKEISVPSFNWQNSKKWNHKDLICTIKNYTKEGKPILKNKDYRHPIYKVNEIYNFKVIGKKRKSTLKGEMEVFSLKGEDEITYEVSMLPGQFQNQNELTSIKCKISKIDHVVKLTQVDIKDPYFLRIDEIVKDKELINKFFIPIFRKRNNLEEDENQLIQQYQAESAFWVFTFANKILDKKFFESIKRYDYKSSKQILTLIICVETWILKKGILTSIHDEILRHRTQKKAQKQLEIAKIKNEVIDFLSENEFTFLENYLTNSNFATNSFFYILIYSNNDLFSEDLLYEIILKFSDNKIFTKNDHYTIKLIQFIYRKKHSFLNQNEIEAFNLTSKKLTKKELDNNNKYLIWSFFEYLIHKSINNIESENIVASQIIRGLSLSEKSFQTKKNLLLNAYNFLENIKISKENPFLFKDYLILNQEFINKEGLIPENQVQGWKEISNSMKEKSILQVSLVGKSDSGYDVIYKGLKGFLPIHHIKNRNLKYFGLSECHFITNVKCLTMNTTFKYFIVEQVDEQDENYFLENKLYKELKIGETIDGIIKSVKHYGLFISTYSGEGLLHIKEIFDFYWDQSQISNYFKVGQNIKAALIEINEKGQLGFSLKKVKNIDNEYYSKFVKQITDPIDSVDFLDFQFEKSILDTIQNEKAICFEQLAFFQFDLNEKLNSFRIAKQFYSNSNSAKSYLINIYTSYFDILLKIKVCLELKSLINFQPIQMEANEIERRINSKTLETFPDANKLIIFLRIIQLFNNLNKESFEELNSFVLEFSKSRNSKSLRIISKITLSNNLMISEINDNDDFILKNLNLIFQFLVKGIITLTENENDRFLREQQEKITYLKKLIAGDESEKLEFKASLLKPYPDEKRLTRLKTLKSMDQNESIKREIDRIDGNLAKKAIVHEAFKNLCAFANSNGGTLLIGVNDDHSIQGIENEFSEILGKKKNRDGFCLRFDELIKEYFGSSFSTLLKTEIVEFPEGSIFVVDVSPASYEVFLQKDEEGKNSEQIFIRNSASAQLLSGKSLVDFIKNRHKDQIRNNIKL